MMCDGESLPRRQRENTGSPKLTEEVGFDL
jgi:hypothetical protein